MRYLLIVIAVLCAGCGEKAKDRLDETEEGLVTTYYFIRHAEKDRNTNDDPELIPQGELRAQFWAEYFEDIHLDAIYSTDYNRTKQTAAPTARAKGITVQLYNPDHMYDAAFQQNTKGKSVLIVGHSNTTPTFVNIVIGQKTYGFIDDAENGMLYTVTVKEGEKPQVAVEKIGMEQIL